MNKKSTRVIRRTMVASQGFIVLEVFPDLLVTKVGADFYIGQNRWVVAEIIDSSPTLRTIVVQQPKEEP